MWKMNVSIHTAHTANSCLTHIPSVSNYLPKQKTEIAAFAIKQQKNKTHDSTFISQKLNPVIDELVSSVSDLNS